jgi:integrase
MKIGVAWKLKWTDFDEEQNTVKCRAEKNGNTRVFEIPSRLILMLNALPKTSEYVFANGNLSGRRWRFDRQKRAR